jgi:hypothetical protein
MGAKKLENCTAEYEGMQYKDDTIWYDGNLSELDRSYVLAASSGMIIMDKRGKSHLLNFSCTRQMILCTPITHYF